MTSRFLAIFGLLTVGAAFGQHAGTSEGPENDLDHAVKVSDDVLWRLDLDDVAEVRTFRYFGNPMILYAYSFIPKTLDRTRKAPMSTASSLGRCSAAQPRALERGKSQPLLRRPRQPAPRLV